jgi:hypothetical protein
MKAIAVAVVLFVILATAFTPGGFVGALGFLATAFVLIGLVHLFTGGTGGV